jgi:molecular chaperone DnaK (HSP70)
MAKNPITHWAVDLGTTNTVVARWLGTHAETVHLEEVADVEPAWQTPLVPSTIFFEDTNKGYIGKKALAAEEVMRATYAGRLTPFARTFKRILARTSQQPVAEVSGSPISARQCATVFMRELLEEINEQERERQGDSIPRWNVVRRFVRWARREGLVNDLTMTVPVDSFEPYRMELENIARKLGVQHFRTIDEPVAAALGYGVDLTEDRFLLVVDFGGGTLDIALVKTNLSQEGGLRRSVGHRRAEVLAARGMNLGGEVVDEWVTEMGVAKLEAHGERFRPHIRAQAESIKRELSGKVLTTDQTAFRLPDQTQLYVTRQEFLQTLEERGLYTMIEKIVDATLEDAEHRFSLVDLDAILLVGGSILLPGVREMFERKFGANLVHYWEPFEAVVKGASIYGAGHYVDQIIHHDYSIRVYNEEAAKPEYEMLVRRGTPYPTKDAFQMRYYAVARDQQFFSLPLCEVGLAGRHALAWNRRANGNYYWLPQGSEENDCVAVLNEGHQIRLTPPGEGSQARLRVEFSIDENRFLRATIHDMKRDKDIYTNEIVQKLR